MLQCFVRFPKFDEFTEFLFHLGKLRVSPCDGFLSFTSGTTPADLLVDTIVSETLYPQRWGEEDFSCQIF